ncbi:hypothetical protein G3I60_36555 [Streptomyces sp. SID13666]|uniref:hypothetical protein n=1 Tax=unclassified Streptomyces TaxID=2593676 RepID=UPI0013C080DB|nr:MULTISPECIES: hypothetical protein [unclassified Streptomyces]NEA59529.1 hypothetical protein [Streptomyces sp. SID13666]NEA72754.1 hypothetical protein [Streptomyces sp. SID13588]
MKRQINRCAAAALAVMLGWAGLTGCSSDSPASAPASSAASAVRSGASSAASAASSAAASAAASAQAAASSALENVKGGLDAKADVTLGPLTTGSDGRTDVPVKVTNHDAKSRRYTGLVNFKNQSGTVVDVSALNVPEVAAGATADATARSNRTLTGTVTAEVLSALRY